MSAASDSTQDIDTLQASSLYLVTKNTAPQQTASPPQNLLERFNLLQVQNEFSHSAVPNTFKSYIDHLPGEFHISKRGRVPVGGSIKKIVAEVPIEENELINFELFNDQTLRDAFTLQDGGYKKKKKKKKKKADGQNGTDGKKHKKRKRNKESQENAPENANGEVPQKKKKRKGEPQAMNGSEHVIVHV